jgi:bifunctional polynucleotide phosphatase/kinase
MSWTKVENENGTMYYHLPEKKYNSEKLLILDLDWTLIQPQLGNVFPLSEDDWSFRFPTKKINEYYAKGYKIVVFSNQMATFEGKLNIDFEGFKRRWTNISNGLNVPAYILIASKDDFYRKPLIGMWEYVCSDLNGDVKVDKKQCIFVGDAAGRSKGDKNKADFSDSDLKMALNAGIDFQTPEQFFKGEKYDKAAVIARINAKSFDSALYLQKLPEIKKKNQSNWDKLEKLFTGQIKNAPRVLMFCGSPSAGKSSLGRRVVDFATDSGNKWQLFSLDIIKTKEKMKQLMNKVLMDENGGGVIVDCTNGNVNPRTEWIQMAQMFNSSIWCLRLITEKNLSFHLNNLRKARCGADPNYGSKFIPNVAIHRYFKSYEEPQLEEGFDEILNFEVEPIFKTKKEEKEFLLRF